MSQGARLTSIEAVPLLKAALQVFADDAGTSLAEFDMELNRANEWIKHDRPDHWKRQMRVCDDRLAEARIALERARMFKSIDGHASSCQEEQKALNIAKQRLRQAEETFEAVRRWGRILEREIIEFRAVINQLASWLQTDFPKATNALERMRGALETYVHIEAPEATSPPPVATSADETQEQNSSSASSETEDEYIPDYTDIEKAKEQKNADANHKS